MNRNPYSPPQSTVSDLTAHDETARVPLGSVTLYSLHQIFAASFIGSPIAAAWFASANFRALRQSTQARRTLIGGVVATVVVLVLAIVLPDSMPNIVLPLAYSLAIRAYAETLFKAVIQDHSSAGGPTGSWWRVVGGSFLWLLVLMVCVGGIVFALVQLELLAE